jgi:hypothetical protein
MYQRIRKAVVGVVTAAGVIVAMATPVDANAAAGSTGIVARPTATRHAVSPATLSNMFLAGNPSGLPERCHSAASTILVGRSSSEPASRRLAQEGPGTTRPDS